MEKKNIMWIAAGSILTIAATIYIVRKLMKDDEEKPPKRAPQLDIENPGSQDNFPAAPAVSDIG